jgi:hypothetical protein
VSCVRLIAGWRAQRLDMDLVEDTIGFRRLPYGVVIQQQEEWRQ